MKIIIDRFEGDFAVAELPDKRMLNVPKALFEGAKEGDAAEITVLGRPYEQDNEGAENPAGIFERLRKSSKKQAKNNDSGED